MDPLTKDYPELTPYQFASNTPIWATDLDGLEANFTTNGVLWGQMGFTHNPVGEEAKEMWNDFLKAYAKTYAEGMTMVAPIGETFDLALLGGLKLLGMTKAANVALKLTKVEASAAKMTKLEVSTVKTVENAANSSARSLLDKALTRQGLKEAPRNFKEKWSEDGFDYEVRIHEPQANAPSGSNSSSETTFRAARRKQGTDSKGQGYGWEQADDSGNWFKTSELKKDEKAANATHIILNKKTK